MSYEEKARIFEEKYAETGSTVAALKAVAAAARSGSKLSREQLGQMRWRRSRGEKLSVIAADFGVTVSYVSKVCSGRRGHEPATVGTVRCGAATSVVGERGAW